jgi:hypothetical protein
MGHTQTVFYSWQSDSPSNFNRDYIESALLEALAQLRSDAKLEPAVRAGLVLDKDTQGVPGSPPITQTILEKIDTCSAFVADLTFVGQSLKSLRSERQPKRLVPNPNVLLEYGYALRSRSHSRIVAVMNTAYGEPRAENLPFDVRHLRWPITYTVGSDSDAQNPTIREDFVSKLIATLKLCLQTPVHETEHGFLEHPSTSDPATFFSTAEDLLPEGIFGRSGEHYSVPSTGKAYLRLIPTESVPVLESELAARILASKGNLRPMGRRYNSWGHARNAFGAIAYASPENGVLYEFSQLFLTREIWGVDAFALNAEKCRDYMNRKVNGFIMSAYVERMYIEALFNYMNFAREALEVPLPWRVEAGLVGIKGYPIAVNQGLRGRVLEDNIFWRSSIESSKAAANEILRPFFSHMWAKCGVPRPTDFDSVLTRYFGEFPTCAD